MTNYEKIKVDAKKIESMDIFQLTNFMVHELNGKYGIEACNYCSAGIKCEFSRELTCQERFLEWLESEVEEDG